MANRSTPLSNIHSGWFKNDVDSTLDLYEAGTKIAAYSSALEAVTGSITASVNITAATDVRVTSGNVRLGTISTFGTTEPTAWVVFRSATQPAGAITTAGGVGSDDTTVQKIIAAGTINNVET